MDPFQYFVTRRPQNDSRLTWPKLDIKLADQDMQALQSMMQRIIGQSMGVPGELLANSVAGSFQAVGEAFRDLSGQAERAAQVFNSTLAGLQLVENRHLTVVTERTVTIKLTRKWKKNRIKRVTKSTAQPDPNLYVMGLKIIGHPVSLAKLRTS